MVQVCVIYLKMVRFCWVHITIVRPRSYVIHHCQDATWVAAGTDKLKNYLQVLLEENMVDETVYKQWVSVDRSTLESICNASDEFVELFCEKCNILLSHSFIAMQQAAFYNDTKSGLKPGEVLVTIDFAEKYAFVLQDSAQGFHWNN